MSSNILDIRRATTRKKVLQGFRMLKRSWAALDSLCPTDDEGGISEFERCLCTGQDRARAAFYGLIKRGDECAVRTETKTFTFITASKLPMLQRIAKSECSDKSNASDSKLSRLELRPLYMLKEFTYVENTIDEVNYRLFLH